MVVRVFKLLSLFLASVCVPICDAVGMQAGIPDHRAVPTTAVNDVDVRILPRGLALEISLTVPIIPQALQLTHPDRAVFDFRGYELRGGNRRIAVNHGPVQQVRLSLFQAQPPITRIVVDSNQPLHFEMKPNDRGVLIEIALSAEAPPSTISSKSPTPPDKELAHGAAEPDNPRPVAKSATRTGQPEEEKEEIEVPHPTGAQPTAYSLQAKARTLTLADLQPLEDKAAAGDQDAETTLALAYHGGALLKRDDAKALHLLEHSANRGFMAAEESLGIFLEMGIGVSQPAPAEAIEWYKKAVRQGSLDAATNLALMYADGIGVAKDPAQALTWFRKAAEGGDATAEYNLALMYERGQAIPQDHKEALHWLKAAADQNVQPAILDLAAFYLHPPDETKPDPEQAVRYYDKAATSGNALAESMLGKIYADGVLGKPDYEQAVAWYKKGADQGQRDAEYGLAVRYLMGQGVALDDEEARRLFRAAADQGLADAQLEAGMLLEQGVGGPAEPALAGHYYELAADQGMPQAQFRLGKLLSNSQEPKDRVAAYKWLLLSQPSVKESSPAMNGLRNSMSHEEIAESERQVDQWRIAHPEKR